MTKRLRIDRLLVERGLFESRTKVRAAVVAGRVRANAALVRKPSDEIARDALLHADAAHPWVSRGGVKLAAALDHFNFDPRGRVCLDVGASTGGFSEVLLTRHARCIYAVDVGRDQLHPQLRAHPRIVPIEQTDVRRLRQAQLPEPPDFVCIDVSFISLKRVLPAVSALVQRPAQLLALIKPQFEAGPGAAKKGIVRDPKLHDAVCADIAGCLKALQWALVGIIPSPIAGSEGNREFFIGARRG